MCSFLCVQWHADDADVTDDRSFSFYFFCNFSPFCHLHPQGQDINPRSSASSVSSACHSSIRKVKILIRGHPYHPRHLRAIKHRFARNETLFCEGENIRFRRVVGGSLRWKATGSSRQLLFVLQRYNIGTRLSSVSPIFFLVFCVLNNFTNPFSVPIRIISNQ